MPLSKDPRQSALSHSRRTWLRLAPGATAAALSAIAWPGIGHGAPAAVTLQTTDPQAAVTLVRGQRLIVRLASNRSTGFRWQVNGPLPAGLRQDSEPLYESDPARPAMPGAGGQETWVFEATNTGTAELNLAYRRPWETGEAAARTLKVLVRVKPH